MCSKQTLCPISVHSISYFFRSNKTYSICFIFFEEEHKVRRMPNLCCSFIDYIKLFGCLNSSKMFYFANNRNPKYIKKTYTASLFLPFARLAEITFLPFFVFILVLNPCVLFLGVLCGWYVLFIPISYIYLASDKASPYLDAILSEYHLKLTKYLSFYSI